MLVAADYGWQEMAACYAEPNGWVRPSAVIYEVTEFGKVFKFFRLKRRLSVLFLMLILEFPDEKHRAAYEDMVHGWRHVEPLTSPARLFTGKDFDEFLSTVQREPTESNPASVPAHLFLLADTKTWTLLGAIQIRHQINHPNLMETGGHIGYGICPGERGKGYATRMLALAMPEAKKIGLTHLLVTCKDANTASWKVIESNGGVFERTTFDDGQLVRRYWMKLAW